MESYNEIYLNDARRSLALMYDYLVNDCHIAPDMCAELFITSGYASLFENGNPGVISGMSGIELAKRILEKTRYLTYIPDRKWSRGKTKEYWAGYALASYQWYSGRTFREIQIIAPVSEMTHLYRLYHEMDIRQLYDELDSRIEKYMLEQPLSLQLLRKNAGMSQSELAKQSGVNIRSIQMYEQKINDISKAQADTIYRLSRALHCPMEQLLQL